MAIFRSRQFFDMREHKSDPIRETFRVFVDMEGQELLGDAFEAANAILLADLDQLEPPLPQGTEIRPLANYNPVSHVMDVTFLRTDAHTTNARELGYTCTSLITEVNTVAEA